MNQQELLAAAEVKTKVKDTRPRFGWCHTLDDEPQEVWETKQETDRSVSVVVIPLPSVSAKIRKQVREFVKELNGRNR